MSQVPVIPDKKPDEKPAENTSVFEQPKLKSVPRKDNTDKSSSLPIKSGMNLRKNPKVCQLENNKILRLDISS